MQTRPRFVFALFPLLATTTADVPAQNLTPRLGIAPEVGRVAGEAKQARIVSVGVVGDPSPEGGRLFHLEADVPKHQIATVERWSPAGNWEVAEDALLSVDGTAEFHVWGDSASGKFRVKSRPFPEVDFTAGAGLQLSEGVSDDMLSLFLRTARGMQLEPPPARQAPVFLEPDVVVPLSQLGPFGVLNGDNPSAGGGVWGAMQGLYKRPKLFLIAAGDEVQTSASAVIGESLKVPLGWNVSREGVKRARYVIQRTPFSDLDAYSPPTDKSVVGWIDNPYYPGNSGQVSFWLDFAKQGIYGIEPPEPFFLRLYEEDANGNIIGWPSNTFTFVVREKEKQWQVPDGELQFKLKRIKCYDTTSGPGNDEIHWAVLRFRFLSDKVVVDEVSKGMRSFGDGNTHWPGHQLAAWDGPANFPDVSNTWYILCMREVDSPHVDEPTFHPGNLQDMSFLATGAWQNGWSQADVLDYIYESFDSFRWWFSHLGSDKIGSWTFRLNTGMMAHAVAHGKKRKSIALSGSGSSYGAWFDLDFYAY